MMLIKELNRMLKKDSVRFMIGMAISLSILALSLTGLLNGPQLFLELI